jgi:hypothetical protein
MPEIFSEYGLKRIKTCQIGVYPTLTNYGYLSIFKMFTYKPYRRRLSALAYYFVRILRFPQDPNDEPAAALLERIRAEREQTSTPKQRGKATPKNSSKQLSIEGIE